VFGSLLRPSAPCPICPMTSLSRQISRKNPDLGLRSTGLIGHIGREVALIPSIVQPGLRGAGYPLRSFRR
jgi:hypothetical protein